jgi:hypothetical protein
MPLTNAEIQAVADRVWAKALKDADGGSVSAGDRLRRLSNRITALLPAGNPDNGASGVNREELFQALLDSQTVPRIINGQPDTANRAILGNVLAYIDNRVADTQKQLTDAVTDITAALDALARQIAAIPTGGPTSFSMSGTLTPEPTQP